MIRTIQRRFSIVLVHIFWPQLPPTSCKVTYQNVVFPCAALQDGERVAVYYGAADTVVGMAFGYIKEIVEFTKNNSIL